MDRLTKLVFLISFLLILSCGEEHPISQKDNLLTPINTPSQSGGEPNLFASTDGQLYLSWIEYLNDSLDALMFSTLKNEQWAAPKEIARSSNWFVNWADFPSLVSYGDGKHLAAHWLQKSATGTYDYDVHVSQSNDGGNNWSPSFVLHKDGISAEHGFVTMISSSADRVFATWLDGRNTKPASDEKETGHDHGHGGGAMSLRGAFFNNNDLTFEDTQLDHRICDCCQTDAVMTKNGPVVVYRDRSEEEIRDIYIVRYNDGNWTEPRPVFNDNWEIGGCPVNGPAITANANQLAVAWYSMADNRPEVKVAFSDDGGANFSTPIKVDEGDPLGRVDVIFEKDIALITWLENVEEKTFIKAAKVSSDGQIERFTLQETSSARNSGFPILERLDNKIILAWTAVDDEGETKIKSAFVHL